MTDQPLKPGWRTYRFDQIAINVNDRVEPGDTDLEYYVGLEHLDSDSLKIRRWGSPDDVGATKLRFRKGDIIFGRRRVYQRKLAVADFDGICSAHAMVLRPKTDVVLAEFLPFFMQSDLFMNRALEISVGSLSPTINWKTLAAQEFSLPPLAEQRQIAEMLGELQEVAKRLYRLNQSGKCLADSILHTLISTAGIGSWHSVPLIELAEQSAHSFVNGPFGSNLLTSDLRSDAGIPVIYIRDIVTGFYERAEEVFVTEEKARSLISACVRSGDLLVTKVGDPPGVAAIYPDQSVDAIVTQDVIRLRPDTSKTSAKYLRAFLNSSYGKQQIARIAIDGTRLRVSLTDFKNIPCPLPSLHRQEIIVGVLDHIETSLVGIQERQVQCRSAVQALLAELIG